MMVGDEGEGEGEELKQAATTNKQVPSEGLQNPYPRKNRQEEVKEDEDEGELRTQDCDSDGNPIEESKSSA